MLVNKTRDVIGAKSIGESIYELVSKKRGKLVTDKDTKKIYYDLALEEKIVCVYSDNEGDLLRDFTKKLEGVELYPANSFFHIDRKEGAFLIPIYDTKHQYGITTVETGYVGREKDEHVITVYSEETHSPVRGTVGASFQVNLRYFLPVKGEHLFPGALEEGQDWESVEPAHVVGLATESKGPFIKGVLYPGTEIGNVFYFRNKPYLKKETPLLFVSQPSEEDFVYSRRARNLLESNYTGMPDFLVKLFAKHLSIEHLGNSGFPKGATRKLYKARKEIADLLKKSVSEEELDSMTVMEKRLYNAITERLPVIFSTVHGLAGQAVCVANEGGGSLPSLPIEILEETDPREEREYIVGSRLHVTYRKWGVVKDVDEGGSLIVQEFMGESGNKDLRPVGTSAIRLEDGPHNFFNDMLPGNSYFLPGQISRGFQVHESAADRLGLHKKDILVSLGVSLKENSVPVVLAQLGEEIIEVPITDVSHPWKLGRKLDKIVPRMGQKYNEEVFKWL